MIIDRSRQIDLTAYEVMSNHYHVVLRVDKAEADRWQREEAHLLGIDEKDWINHIRYFERQFPTVAGNIDKLREFARLTSRRWIKGMGCAFCPLKEPL